MFPISLRSKRAQLALRFFTYGVMTLATVVLTALAIFYALGYRFNQATLTFEQGGLVQFRSTPEGATVVVDGKVQNFKTPGRTNLTAGVHTIVMQMDGYREWQRTVSLAPGQLLWLNYTRFIPNSITTVPLKTFGSMANAVSSPDHRWMIVQEKPDVPVFTLIDFNDETKPVYSDFTLATDKLTKVNGKFGQFNITEWDLGSRYFLVQHQNGSVNEWLRVDRTQLDQAVNLTQVFGFTITEAHFAGTNPNLIYAKTDNVLRRLDIGANSASAALVDGLDQFTVFGDDTVTYSAANQDTANLPAIGVYQHDKKTVVRSFAAGAKLKFAYSEYDNHNYLAYTTGDGRVQVLRDPATSSSKDTTEFASFMVGKPAQWLMFSNSGRMVAAGADNTLVTYDLELDKTYSSTPSFLGSTGVRPLKWLDDYYLWSDYGDKLHIVEFDGQNDREITGVSAGFTVNLSQSGKTLFSIGKNTVNNTYVLQSSNLIK